MKKLRKRIKEFGRGKMAVVFDSKNRENEADLIVSIEKLKPQQVNFMITEGKGLLCAAISRQIAQDLGLALMPSTNTDPFSTRFTLSIDSRKCRTGISAYERWETAMAMIRPESRMADFITPGHLFPIIAEDDGLLVRRGHTEAAVELCRWNGLKEAALICEMVHDEGMMLSREEAEKWAAEKGLPFFTISELENYQKHDKSNVEKTAQAKLFTRWGEFSISVYQEKGTGKEHVFLSQGDFSKGPVRLHSECFTGDILSSQSCDCQGQLHHALDRIAEEGRGAIVYLRQEGRNIGLAEKIKAYQLQQDKGMDTVEANLALGHQADDRDYHQAAWILKEEGFSQVRLLTNNPKKIEAMEAHGLKIIREKTATCLHEKNKHYLKTKINKMGHMINTEEVH